MDLEAQSALPLQPWTPPPYPPPYPYRFPDPPAPEGQAAPVRPREIAAVAALSVAAELTLWGGSGGAGEAVLFAVVPAVLLFVARKRRISARAGAIALLLALLAARGLWESSAGTALLGTCLLFAFAVALRSSRPYVVELFVGAFASLFGAFKQSFLVATAGARMATPRRLAGFRWITVAVPTAVVGLFGLVFAAANPLVERWAGAIAERLFTLTWLPTWGHVLFWIFCAFVSVALVRPARRAVAAWAHELGSDEAIDEGAPARSDTAIATARNVLLSVNALFFAYNALDAVYLWAGSPPPGVDHTAYAHRGATWLTIALVLSTIVLGVIFRGTTGIDPRARAVRALSYAWAGQNFVLAAGTFRRVLIYVSYSGLTQLRIFGMFGTALVVAGLALLVVKLARRRNVTWLLRRQLDAFVVALVLFVITPTHAIVTRFNVARVEEMQYRPLLHFVEQSTSPEGMAGVIPLLSHPDPIVQRGAAGLLADYAERLDARAPARWTEWEGSRGAAIRRIAEARPTIAALVPDADARVRARDELGALADRSNGDEEQHRWSSRER
jgi:hypothetical protein